MHQRYKGQPGPAAWVLRKIARAKHVVYSVLTGSDIDIGAHFGSNLRLPHVTGIVIHGSVRMGDDCMVMQQVTLGQLAVDGVPRIGSRVYIGAGAKVLGAVVIGDDAQIGANAVVLSDVPAKATAVGIPARIILRQVAIDADRSTLPVVGQVAPAIPSQSADRPSERSG